MPRELYVSADVDPAAAAVSGLDRDRLIRTGAPPAEATAADVAWIAGVAGVPVRGVGKRSMPRELLSDRPHTHHALDDAIEHADLFCNVMQWRRGG